jgi:hypothetical protein
MLIVILLWFLRMVFPFNLNVTPKGEFFLVFFLWKRDFLTFLPRLFPLGFVVLFFWLTSLQGKNFLNRHSVKPHEVRALASSWALFNSASISEVLSAGFWRCQDSFTSFYLRSMSAQADSLFSLGPIVAAQHVSVPLVSERSGDSAVC